MSEYDDIFPRRLKQIMTWREYEKLIYDLLCLYFPTAKVSRDAKIIGRYTKRKRQIDILVEESIGGNTLRIAVDCKLYNKKVNVKAVESFVGMLGDIGAEKGLMVTEKGYTETALKRARNNPSHLELDIYSLAELKAFQAEAAFPHAGDCAAMIVAPFGWAIDGRTNPGQYLCMLYQRGLSLEEAVTQKEFAYINFWNRDHAVGDLKSLLEHQESNMRTKKAVKSIRYLDSVQRKDAQTKLRIADIEGYPGLEVTGFVEFQKFIFFVVCFSRDIVLERNLRKIEGIMRTVKPGTFKDERKQK